MLIPSVGKKCAVYSLMNISNVVDYYLSLTVEHHFTISLVSWFVTGQTRKTSKSCENLTKFLLDWAILFCLSCTR